MNQNTSIYALICRSGEPPEYRRIINNLKNFREILNCRTIESLKIDEWIILMDEEGKLKYKPFNRPIIKGGKMIDYLVGDLIIVKDNGDDFGSIAPWLKAKAMERFSKGAIYL